MEASPQPPPPQAPPPPAPPATGGGPRWPAILVAIVFALAAIFFAAVSISLAGDTLCEDAAQEAAETGQFLVECTEKSAGNRAATVIAGGLAAIASLWVVFASVGVARGRRAWGSLGIPVGLAVVLAIITIVL